MQRPASSPFVAGVDSGGTRTRARIADPAGRVLAEAEGPAGLLVRGGEAASVEAIAGALGAAVRAAGRTPDELPGAIWAGVAGAGDPARRAALEGAMRIRFPGVTVRISPDSEIAFHAAFGEGAGILLISGTGSVARARGPSGSLARVGGWGADLGDEGSGYAVGLAALRAITRAADGRGRRTSLEAAVLGHLGLRAPAELVDWVHHATKAEVAALHRRVTEEAGAGQDAEARAILRDAARALAELVLVAAREAGCPPGTPVALTGGVIDPGEPVRERLVRSLARRGHPVRTDPLVPVAGALDLARHLLPSIS